MGNLMDSRRRIIEAQPHLATANGGTVLIATPKIEKLRVTFRFSQSGSGVASPSNVRPINGINTASVMIGAETKSIALGSTYYGGIVDLVSGVLTVSHYYVDVSPSVLPIMEKYSITNGAFVARFLTDDNGIPLPVEQSGVSNRFSQSIASGPGRINTTYNGRLYLFIPVSEMAGDTVADAWEWLSNHPTQIVYQVSTPQTIQLDPQSINALTGWHEVSSNLGDVEITYWTH